MTGWWGSIPGTHKRAFRLAFVFRTTLGSTQAPVEWVPVFLSPGVNCGRSVTLTALPHLVPRSRISRSYTSSTTSVSMACSGTILLYF
jgi:hypothetical protein